MIKKVTSQQELDDAVAAGHQVVVHEGEYEVAGSATVRAYGSATVWADGSATVRADGSATVWAYGSATVRADGSATVWADGSATVRAGDLVAFRRASEHASISGGVVIEVPDLADPASPLT